MSYDNPQQMRDQLDQAAIQALKNWPLDSSLEEFDVEVPMRDGFTHNATVVRPKTKSNKGRPLIVLIHGGGFCAGSTKLLACPARNFAKAFDAVVVSCTYRLSPEYKFPVHFDDSMDTVSWIVRHAKGDLGADVEAGFIIGGQSAGATLAAAVLQHMQDEKMEPRATGSFLCIPLLLTSDIVPPQYRDMWTSRDDNGDRVPLLSEDGVAQMVKAMETDPKSPKFSPFNSANPHRGLPRTYIQVGQLDPLRDDGIVYERALRDAGVETRLDKYMTIGHDTWSIFSNHDSPKGYEEKTLSAMRWLLG